jgi:hypothetical protein
MGVKSEIIAVDQSDLDLGKLGDAPFELEAA